MSIVKSLDDKPVKDIIEFLTEYYSSFIVEDSFFQSLRNSTKTIVKKLKKKYYSQCVNTYYKSKCKNDVKKLLDELKKIIYAESNEPVRLGAFRVLFNEVHKRVHGTLHFKSTSGIDLAIHGVLREKLIILSRREQISSQSYQVGIDYISLTEYPAHNQRRKVVVPIFVIAKSSYDQVKDIKILEAINIAQNQIASSDKVNQALQNIAKFTRIVLTRAIYKREETKEQPCVINKHDNIEVYSDIACGVIGLTFKDIPEIYEEILKDNKLAELSIKDWIEALLHLVMPVPQIITASASSPPRPPGHGHIDQAINDIVNQIRQKALSRLGKEIEKQINYVNNSIDLIKTELEKNLTNIINSYKKNSNEQLRLRTI